MPLYEYACQRCFHTLEVLQKFADEPLSECPMCHEASLTKLLSAPAFHLKGTGWYATDTRNKDKQTPKPEAETSVKTEEKVIDTTQTTAGTS